MQSLNQPQLVSLHPPRQAHPRRWSAFAGFLDFVDTTIVNVALPSIRHGLGFSVANLQWVISGYLLTYGGLLLLGGRAADLLGRRRLLIGRDLAVRPVLPHRRARR